MQPTLNSADEPNAFGINDFVLVEKWTSRAHWYRRGDVVLLRCAPGQKSVLLLPLVLCSVSAASACGVGATSQSNALERPRAATLCEGMSGRWQSQLTRRLQPADC